MKRLLLIICSIVLAVSCERSPRLVILHLNDTHSHYEPDRMGETKGMGGIIERAAYIDSVRNACGEDRVLLLHAGDFGQGTSYFTMLNGLVETDMMNALRYDVATLGNHEFDNGIEELTERVKKMSTRIVCANVDFSQFELGQYVSPYVIVEKAGMKIGIIGLAPDLASLVSKNVSARLPQSDYAECINKCTEAIKDSCDMIILLSHAGYENDCSFISQTHGLDLLIGGHSHKYMDEMLPLTDADGRTVPMITDGFFGYNVGEIKVY